MTEQELREKIAKEVGQHTENCPWEVCSESEQNAAYRSADFILTLIKEALPELAKDDLHEQATLKRIKEELEKHELLEGEVPPQITGVRVIPDSWWRKCWEGIE